MRHAGSCLTPVFRGKRCFLHCRQSMVFKNFKTLVAKVSCPWFRYKKKFGLTWNPVPLFLGLQCHVPPKQKEDGFVKACK